MCRGAKNWSLRTLGPSIPKIARQYRASSKLHGYFPQKASVASPVSLLAAVWVLLVVLVDWLRLSGGVLQNMTILEKLVKAIWGDGMFVLGMICCPKG